MTEQINIKEQSVEKLESIAYRLITQINQLNQALQQVQAEIQERYNTAPSLTTPEK